jgi:putative acyl-CoA dehydrogenase
LASDPRLTRSAGQLRREITDSTDPESRARRIVERMAVVLQGSLLLRFGDRASAEAFCASRLGGDWGHSFGTLPPGTEFASIVERHRPATNK